MAADRLFDDSGEPDWILPPEFPSLGNNEVHIWLVQLAHSTQTVSLRTYLSQEETQQCQRYKVETVRHRFISSRGYLRLLLGAYRKTVPGSLNIALGEHGKPYLVPDESEPLLHFNLSHSGDLLIYALTLAGETGIDIEHIHPIKEMETIIRRFFSPRECNSILSLPQHEQTNAFFYFWTRKEALIKANGKGFSMPLNRFSVPAVADDTILYEGMDTDDTLRKDYSFLTFRPQENYIVSLATESDSRLQYRYWAVQLEQGE